MKLFTKDIDQKLFDQYMMGNDLENQMVVAKIFNPYGNGVWYLLNSDPSDPDYLWAIVDLFEVEVGSVSREELETLKVPPFRLGLERDLYFTPMNAKKLYEAMLSGEKFEDGGTIDIKKDKSGESWVFPNNPKGETYGIKLAAGGMTAGRYYKDISGQELRYIGESQGKLLFKDGEKVVYKQESDFEDAPQEKRIFGFFEDGGKTQSKRYKVNVYYGGEMEDEEFYTDSLDEAERASQGGEHSEIYDNHKKEFVETEYAKGGELDKTILKNIYKNYDIYKDGKNQEHYSDFNDSVKVRNHIEQTTGFKVLEIKELEIGKNYPDNFSNPYYYDTYEVKLSKGKPFVVERMYGRPRWTGNVAYTNGIDVKDLYKMAKGGGVGFTPYGETKGIYKVYYKADGKPQTEIWETKEMAVNTAKRYSSPQMQDEFSNVKVFDEDGAEVDYITEAKYEDGGDTDEGVDLFEDYDDIPQNVQKVLDKHSESFDNEDYKGLEKAKKDLEKIGYTFEYGLDGTAYDLRKIGQKGKNDDEYAKGGEVKQNYIVKLLDVLRLAMKRSEGNRWYTHGTIVSLKGYDKMSLNYLIPNDYPISDKYKVGLGAVLSYKKDNVEYKYEFSTENKEKSESIDNARKITWIYMPLTQDVAKQIYNQLEKQGDIKELQTWSIENSYEQGGELMKHKHLEYVTIELIEPTSKGWKVKKIETHSVRGRKLSTPKEKVAYFSKEEIKDLFEPMMAMGGTTKFKDKVQSIKASLLKRKKVSPKVQKDYGKTYSPKEAEESAKRIAGSMVKKEKRQPRVSKMLEKMKKGTQLNKKKSTFKDRMKDLSTKIKERKSKSTK